MNTSHEMNYVAQIAMSLLLVLCDLVDTEVRVSVKTNVCASVLDLYKFKNFKFSKHGQLISI